MSKLSLGTYTHGSIQFPLSTDSTKDDDWYKRWAQAVLRVWCQDQGGTSSIFMTEVDELRAYAEGNQDNEKYKDKICYTDPKTKERVSYSNISWDNVNIMQKTMESAVNSLMTQEYDVFSVALDEGAVSARMAEKYRLTVQSKLKSLGEEMGLGERPEVPDNLQQLDMMVKGGSLKLGVEMAADMLTNKTFKDSDWDDKIKIQVLRDLFVIGTAAVFDKVDIGAQEVLMDYVDPKYLILPYSKDPTYSDVPFIGHIDFISEQKFKKEASEAGIKEVEIQNTIRRCKDGTSENDSYMENLQSAVETRFNGDTGIPVLRLEFRDEQREQMVERKTKSGDLVAMEEEYNEQAKDTGKRKFHKRKRQVMRVLNFVLNSELCYGHGVKTDVGYIKKLPCFSYHVYKSTTKSKVSQVMSLIDDMQLAILRTRSSQANAAPDGHAFDVDAMMNITMGGKNWDPRELMQLLKHTGDTVFKSTSHKSQYVGSSGGPVIPLQGGTGRYYEEQLGIIDRSIRMVAEITGFNEFMTGSNPTQEISVGNQKQLMQSSSNILRTQLLAYKSIKERAAVSIVKRWQVIAKNKNIRVHTDAVGGGVSEFMEVSSDISMHNLGIYSIMKPSEESKALIKDAALQSVAANRQGAVGITWGDYFFIERTLDSGNVKLAQLVMSQREEAAQQRYEDSMRENQQASQMAGAELEKQKQQNVALQSQAVQEQIQIKGQMDTERALAVENAKHQGDLKEIDRKGHWDMKKPQRN